MEKIRVLVANRPRLMRELVLATISDQPDIEIMGEIRDDAEIVQIVAESHPDVVIIAQTAYATPKDIKDCLKAGCNDYLSKPIMYEKMILLLDQYLRKK